ncbi:MAG: hypothetical protein ACREO7_11835 [Pseudoxanthomonas sp.]
MWTQVWDAVQAARVEGKGRNGSVRSACQGRVWLLPVEKTTRIPALQAIDQPLQAGDLVAWRQGRPNLWIAGLDGLAEVFPPRGKPALLISKSSG